MAYGNSPGSSQADAVRLHIGDTDNDDLILSDEEVTYILSVESNTLRAAARAARIAAGKYARQVDSEIDEIRLRAQARFDHYSQLADDLAQEAKTSGGGMKLTGIWFGGISQTEKDTNEEDEDLVNPAFRRDLHAHDDNNDDIYEESLEN